MSHIVLVHWLDSAVQHGQVDDDALPTPSELHSVGFLSRETPDFIVLSRDHAPAPDSYAWRSSLAIPRAHVLAMERITP